MKILLDNNVPRLLRNNLPGHQVDVALQFSWHTVVKMVDFSYKPTVSHS